MKIVAILLLLFAAAEGCYFIFFFTYSFGYGRGYRDANKEHYANRYGKEEAEKYFGKKREKK